MKRKKLLYDILITIIILFGIYTIGGACYMVNFALTPDTKITKNQRTAMDRLFKDYPYTKPWIDSLKRCNAFRDTSMVNKEGLKLHGYYIRADKPTKKTALLIHGYTDCAYSMLSIAYLYSHGLHYNVILPDLQHHGKSEGKAVTMGWKDSFDMLGWAQLANQIFGDSTQIVVHGISMGGATTMMLSGLPQPYYIKCYVDDCGYTSAWDEFSHELKVMFDLPDFPVLYSASALCKLKYGWSFGECSALKQVAKCKQPMLFIHGNIDTYVPSRMVLPLYEAKPQPKELWVVKNATHAQSYSNNPQEYTRRIARFVNKYIS